MHVVETWQVGKKDTVLIEILTKLTDETNSTNDQTKYAWKNTQNTVVVTNMYILREYCSIYATSHTF